MATNQTQPLYLASLAQYNVEFGTEWVTISIFERFFPFQIRHFEDVHSDQFSKKSLRN